ncbi:lactate utilization protein [Christensenellaceae bacterium OttesenSCG-928-L17]|nr:lactate utilization protein [Christensenellaceae bacterium OttesenSCG-928-L17]
MSRIETTAANLRKNNFHAEVFETAAEAKAAAKALIGSGSVGFGGSVTVRDTGLYEDLQAQGNAVYWHWKAGSKEELPAIFAGAHTADVYLSSSNAILESGALLNIDGTGNRLANLFYGPQRVIILAGQNKIVNNYDEGIERIKREACPPNARRLNLETPCAITGKCNNCHHAQRMCKVTLLLERPANARQDVHVFLIKEDLGY